MWTRQELKVRGKAAFKGNYWKSVLVAFLATIMTGSAMTYSNNIRLNSTDSGYGSYPGTAYPDYGLLSLIVGIALIVTVVAIAMSILLINPLMVGCVNFFLENRRDASTGLNALEAGFKNNWKNNVIVMFMKDLIIFLWSLLLIVPGIIKTYSYRLVPFILAENPGIGYKEAMEESDRLMKGNKADAFLLDLSFFGWLFLGVLTLGLLNVFYVYPYIEATNAELYIAIAHAGEADTTQAAACNTQTVEFEVSK